ncbi:MAG: hypothetical protein O7E52_03485 [Candidatus Poribacteria bacterium]|nr:hypothetical protein [Candidatus Poribacteria bacterium]
MRVIAVGCEYTGVTTLLEDLMAWGHERGINHHLDDHFSIPDRQFLAPEEKEVMVHLPPTLKERFQRFQIAYHVLLIQRYEHILLGGFHIEEAVYGPLYYYPGRAAYWLREFEAEMPDDAILAHLTATPEVIEARMKADPHEYQIIQTADIPRVLDDFQREVGASTIKHKIQIDTSDLAWNALLQTFLDQSIPHLNTRDVLTRMLEK